MELQVGDLIFFNHFAIGIISKIEFNPEKSFSYLNQDRRRLTILMILEETPLKYSIQEKITTLIGNPTDYLDYQWELIKIFRKPIEYLEYIKELDISAEVDYHYLNGIKTMERLLSGKIAIEPLLTNEHFVIREFAKGICHYPAI